MGAKVDFDRFELATISNFLLDCCGTESKPACMVVIRVRLDRGEMLVEAWKYNKTAAD